jgi:hypothetical protein
MHWVEVLVHHLLLLLLLWLHMLLLHLPLVAARAAGAAGTAQQLLRLLLRLQLLPRAQHATEPLRGLQIPHVRWFAGK